MAADEKDIIRLRTNYRKERVYAYRLQVSKERAKALLLDYIDKMNNLAAKPEFYDALTRNCTTAIHLHSLASSILPKSPTVCFLESKTICLLRSCSSLRGLALLLSMKPACISLHVIVTPF